MTDLTPDPTLIARFTADLDALIERGKRFGVAVSGGPDSVALLLLAVAARPGEFEAATVDHGLRAESRPEAEMVADMSESHGVPHTILAIEWDEPPSSAIQEQARQVRYGALAAWMRARSLDALVTAHHLDDQAETLLMRLNRGSGVRGLAGMRPKTTVFGDPGLMLLRPLLSWRREELAAICADAGVEPVADPSNADEQFERVRIRRALAQAKWLDADSLGLSASNLAAADEALDWAANQEWRRSVEQTQGEIVYRPSDAPGEILRRVVSQAIAQLAAEGSPDDLRGRKLDHVMAELESGRTATLRGVRCAGGMEWRFTRAAPRRSG